MCQNLTANNFLIHVRISSEQFMNSIDLKDTCQKIAFAEFEEFSCARKCLVALLISHIFACKFSGKKYR